MLTQVRTQNIHIYFKRNRRVEDSIDNFKLTIFRFSLFIYVVN